MRNLYTSSINYHLGEKPYVHPGFNMPRVGEYMTSSVIGYDEITQTDIVSAITGIASDMYMPSNTEKNIKLTDLYLNYSRLQGLSTNIQEYCKQVYLKDTRKNIANTQDINAPDTSALSRQVQIRVNTVVTLQKNQYAIKERDRLYWLLRSKNKTTNKYEYWKSENISSGAPSRDDEPKGREVLGSYFLEGSKSIGQYSVNYSGSIQGYDVDIPVKGPATEVHTSSVEAFIVLSPDNQRIETVTNLPEKQTYLQKQNLQDIRKILKVWDKRGFGSNKNKYSYWKQNKISPDSTKYNTNPNSNETLGSHYEKQE